MSDVIKVHGAYPKCAHSGCNKHGDDGYCTAACCGPDSPTGQRRAYCVEHSHRPTRVLEILGHSHDQTTFTRAEMEAVLRAMWVGAGMVFESEGHFAMIRDVDAKVRAAVDRVSASVDAAAAVVRELKVRLRRDVTIAGVTHRAGSLMDVKPTPGGHMGVEFGHGALFPLDSEEYEVV